MHHRQEIMGVIGIECPKINNLFPMSVDDGDFLTLLDLKGHGLSSGNGTHFVRKVNQEICDGQAQN